VKIGDTNSTPRYLDPTPEYAERLRNYQTCHIHDTERLVPDIPSKTLFSAKEVAFLLGWTEKYTWTQVSRRRVPRVRLGRFTMFTADTIRDLLWNVRGKRNAKNSCPFLMHELIEWFQKYQAAQDKLLPTDAELAEDDIFKAKLALMMKMPSPRKELAMNEFFEKAEIARSASRALTYDPTSSLPR
jgi:hypothetical protein